MAGIYARVDNQRGVWKAPANEVIRGIDSLEVKLSKGDQDVLNPEPNNICVLRDFRDARAWASGVWRSLYHQS